MGTLTMSTSYSAYVIFGIRLNKSDLCIKTPHPLWGIHKFDPENGKKVEQFIKKEIYADELVNGLTQSFINDYAIHAYRDDQVFLGHVISEVDGWGNNGQSNIARDCDPEVKERVIAVLTQRLHEQLPHFKFDREDFKPYLILYVG